MNQFGLIRHAPLTIILIVLCVVLYVPDLLGYSLSSYMAVRAGGIAQAPWTLITAMFAHGSVMHLLFNMVSLWYMGSLLENLQGTPRFAVVYFLSGIAGNVAFAMYGTGAAVGASGAIFGLLGACALLLYSMRSNPAAKSMLSGLVSMLGINIINSFVPGIAMEAHFGGLLVGVIVETVLLFTPLAAMGGESSTSQGVTGQAEMGSSSIGGTGPSARTLGEPEGEPAPLPADQTAEWPVSDTGDPIPPAPYAAPETLSSAGSAYMDEPVEKPVRGKKSTIIAIVVSLAVTLLAFGALVMSNFGPGLFAPARVIGSETAKAVNPQSSVQWAGDDEAGFVQVPSDWEITFEKAQISGVPSSLSHSIPASASLSYSTPASASQSCARSR